METKTIIIIVTVVLLLVGIGCAVYFSTRTQKKPIVPWTSQQLSSAVKYFTQTGNFPDSIVQCLANESSTLYNYDDFVNDKDAVVKTTTCMGTKGAWSKDLINFIISHASYVPKACLVCLYNLIQQDYSPNEMIGLGDADSKKIIMTYMKKCKECTR